MSSSRADQLADHLSLQILRGALAPGARLPSVRELARQHGVSPSTIQRVLVLLEARGLVRARDRAGIEVLDPQRHASLSVWPLLVAHAADHPEVGLRLLEDALATRRALAVDVVGGILRSDPAGALAAIGPQIDAFLAVATDPGAATPAALCAAEHELLRSVLVAARRPAVLGILNGIERVVAASPDLVHALYARPEAAVAGWSGLRALLSQPAPIGLLTVLDDALRAADQRALALVAETVGVPFPLPDAPSAAPSAAPEPSRSAP